MTNKSATISNVRNIKVQQFQVPNIKEQQKARTKQSEAFLRVTLRFVKRKCNKATV